MHKIIDHFVVFIGKLGAIFFRFSCYTQSNRKPNNSSKFSVMPSSLPLNRHSFQITLLLFRCGCECAQLHHAAVSIHFDVHHRIHTISMTSWLVDLCVSNYRTCHREWRCFNFFSRTSFYSAMHMFSIIFFFFVFFDASFIIASIARFVRVLFSIQPANAE